MDRQKKIMLAGITAIVFTVFLASPALARRKPRLVIKHPSGSPKWVQAGSSESVKPAAAMQSETKGFDLLGGVADIVTGTLNTLGNAVEAIFGRKAESVSQVQKNKARNYKYVPRRRGGQPRWVRVATD